jgi:NAD/NADP transhydrogenase beta subunit
MHSPTVEVSMLIEGLIAVVVVIAVLALQMRARPVRSSPRAAVIVTVVGAVLAWRFVSSHDVPLSDQALVIVSLVIGAAIAVARAYTVRLSRVDGVLTAQGTVATLALWIVGIAAHLGIELLGGESGLGSASLTLYIGVVALVQSVVILLRAKSAGLVSEDVDLFARRSELRGHLGTERRRSGRRADR